MILLVKAYVFLLFQWLFNVCNGTEQERKKHVQTLKSMYKL